MAAAEPVLLVRVSLLPSTWYAIALTEIDRIGELLDDADETWDAAEKEEMISTARESSMKTLPVLIEAATGVAGEPFPGAEAIGRDDLMEIAQPIWDRLGVTSTERELALAMARALITTAEG